jgi:hypothetical protein
MDPAPPPLSIARRLELLATLPTRTFAITCSLHILIIAMFVYIAVYERNPFIITSTLSLLTWTYIRPSFIAIRVLCDNAYNLLRQIRLPALPRLTTTHTNQPFTWAFYNPVATRPIPPADVMPEHRPVYKTCPVFEEASALSVWNVPPIGPEQRRASQIYYADSFSRLTCYYSG